MIRYTVTDRPHLLSCHHHRCMLHVYYVLDNPLYNCLLNMGLSEVGKRVRTYKNSSGNTKRLFQQIPQKLRHADTIKPVDEEEIISKLQANKNCCSNGYHFLGCLGRKFLDVNVDGDMTNMPKLIEYVKRCRVITIHKDKLEMRQFIKDLYIRSEILDSQGRTKAMDYRLPFFEDFSNYINTENNKVCRKGIATVYGFSVKLIQLCSSTKKQGILHKFLGCTQSFTDATIHSSNFAETAKAFRDNLVDVNFVGELL
jgi:hypothetical protein